MPLILFVLFIFLNGSFAQGAEESTPPPNPEPNKERPVSSDPDLSQKVSKELTVLSEWTSPQKSQSSMFGLATEMDDTYAYVGAPWQNGTHQKLSLERSGAVHIYNTKTLKHLLTLYSPEPSVRAMFGSSLASNGEFLAVGAPSASFGGLYNTGVVYIFRLSDWSVVDTLKPNAPKSGDFFGTSLAWSDDKALVVGAHLSDKQGIDSGAVYVFEPTAVKDTSEKSKKNPKSSFKWIQKQTLLPKAIQSGSLLGNAIDISGHRMVIGAYGHEGLAPSSGAVFIYEKSKGTWKETAYLSPNERRAFIEYGWSVSIHQDQLVVGAPYEGRSQEQSGTVYPYRFNAEEGVWDLQEKITLSKDFPHQYFGGSLQLTSQALYVTAPFGDVFIYKPLETHTKWQLTHQLVKQGFLGRQLSSNVLSVYEPFILSGIPIQSNEMGSFMSSSSLTPLDAPSVLQKAILATYP